MEDHVSEHAIVEGVADQGFFQALIDEPTAQGLVDLRWSVLRAGRRLGIRLQVEFGYGRGDGFTVVSVAPRLENVHHERGSREP